MKIKLAIVEKNTSYLGRLASTFTERYSDKFEVYSFTDLSVAISTVTTTKMDVLLVSDAFEFDASSVKGKCGIAYLVDSPDINTLNNQKTICRFQKADLIYKQILNIYAESAGNISGMTIEAKNTIEEADLIVGFSTYVNLVKEIFPNANYIDTGIN